MLIYAYAYLNIFNFLQYFVLKGAESSQTVVFTHLFTLLIRKLDMLDLILFLSHAIRIHTIY